MKSKNIGYNIGLVLAWIIIICGLILSLWFIYHIQDIVKSIFNILSPIAKLDAVIIVAIIGAIATFIVNIISKRLDHKFELKKYLSDKRQRSYEDFLKMFFDILESDGKEIEDIPKRLNEFKQTLLLYGSKKTYKSFEKYWKHISSDSPDAEKSIDLMERVVSEMRRDAGAGPLKENIISNIVRNDMK
ncbi:MAG: hypothetical protein IKF82_06460 [Bacilli bacterium]|nr:hypothetical protein [bacterium]MBR3209891.1 hypothetical protein [Bacilli bacterium]